ncbi:MAG: hypothetical protein KDA37_12105, partial [Planctomycetales bacterium]|nr:hypothetical protein [Planctomycetales bacterium]
MISLIPLLVLLGLLMGGVVVLVALLANKQTRPFALGMLGVGSLILLLGFSTLVLWRSAAAVRSPEQASASMTSTGAGIASVAPAHAGFRADQDTVVMRAVPAEHTHVHDWSFYTPHSPLQPAAGVRASWAVMLLVFVGIAVLYGIMKLLNNRDGKGGRLVVGAAIGLAMFLGIMALNFAAKPRPQEARFLSAAADDWEELTRPRIELSEGPPVKYTVVVNGRELAFTSNTPMSEAISEVEKVYKEDGRELNIRYGHTQSGMAGEFNRARIGDMLYEALTAARQEQAREADLFADHSTEKTDAQPSEPADAEGQPGRVTLEYRDAEQGDVTINIENSVGNEGVANEIQSRLKQLAGDKMLVKVDNATMTFTSGTPEDAILKAI